MNFYRKKALLLFIGIFTFTFVFADEGEDLFNLTCKVCHTIGKGRLVGPDLKNVTEKRNQDWLISFIKSSSSVINSGDADAKAIFEEYNKLLMPDNNYSDAQIIAILNYIGGGSSATGVQGETQGETQAEVPVADILSELTPENINTGAYLFEGKQRLTNGGPVCSSCHKVIDERIFSSGTLAKDLSESHDNMGSAGLMAIIKSPPYPVMKEAYKNHALTEGEVMNLGAYLKSVSEQRVNQKPADFSLEFFVYGLIFFVMIVMGTVTLYSKRKKLAVNHDILNRPSKVVN